MVAGRYLDSSALVKLVAMEPESEALLALLDDDLPRMTSVVARIEVERAVLRAGVEDAAAVEALFDAVVVVDLTPSIVALAIRLHPLTLRTLDAIHLATAFDLGDDVESIVAYDTRLTAAAQDLGLRVQHPGVPVDR